MVLGSLLALAGAHELRSLLLLTEALLLATCVSHAVAIALGISEASSVLFAPAYLPVVVPLAFLTTLIAPAGIVAHAASSSAAAGTLMLQIAAWHSQATLLPTCTSPHDDHRTCAEAQHTPFTVDLWTALPPMAAALLAPLLAAALRLPRGIHESLAASLVGSQVCAIGGAHLLGCAWLDQITTFLMGAALSTHAAGTSPSPSPSGAAATDGAVEGGVLRGGALGGGPGSGHGGGDGLPAAILLYASCGMAVCGAAYQLALHCHRGTFQPHQAGPAQRAGAGATAYPQAAPRRAWGLRWLRASTRRLPLWRRLGSKSELRSPLAALDGDSDRYEVSGGAGSPMRHHAIGEAEQSAFEAALQRELDIEPPPPEHARRRSSEWGVDCGSAAEVAGCTSLEALRHTVVPMSRAVGLQEASVDVQLRHLAALLADARRRQEGGAAAAASEHASEYAAVRAVHSALFSNYSQWCARLGVAERSCGLLEDCVLYLCIWGEAANLRHMPEMLCWLFHQLCAHRQALLSGCAVHSPPAPPAEAPTHEHPSAGHHRHPRRRLDLLSPFAPEAAAAAATALPRRPPPSSEGVPPSPPSSPPPTAETSPSHRMPPTPPAMSPMPANSPVICYSFLATVVRPITDVVRSRMRADLPAEQRLTYDDL